MYTNKTCQTHKSTYGSLTKTNEKKIFTSTLTVKLVELYDEYFS